MSESNWNSENHHWVGPALKEHQLWLKTRFSDDPQGAKFTVPIDRHLSGADLSDADLSDSCLRLVDLSGADLSDANLRDADLSGADLSGADLTGADLRIANLMGANLSGANLRSADLRDSNLINANLSGANLINADLSYTNLSGANLINANLINANLRFTDLRSTVGNGKEIITLQSLKYPITYTHDDLQIGDKNYPIADWWEFSDAVIWIGCMDVGALEWWRTHKSILKSWIDANPAQFLG